MVRFISFAIIVFLTVGVLAACAERERADRADEIGAADETPTATASPAP
jgi:hypothetical protein